jgi:hypothetical protein
VRGSKRWRRGVQYHCVSIGRVKNSTRTACAGVGSLQMGGEKARAASGKCSCMPPFQTVVHCVVYVPFHFGAVATRMTRPALISSMISTVLMYIGRANVTSNHSRPPFCTTMHRGA